MKVVGLFLFLFLFGAEVCAQCTTLCPIILATSLTLAEKLGVKNEVVGVLAGALMSVIGYILIRFFEKKKWTFYGRNYFLMLLSISSIALIYVNKLTYKPALHWNLIYIDSFLLASICGALSHILGNKFYEWLKIKNGGHAHFPFEKVVVPLIFDLVVVWIFWGSDLCACKEILIL